MVSHKCIAINAIRKESSEKYAILNFGFNMHIIEHTTTIIWSSKSAKQIIITPVCRLVFEKLKIKINKIKKSQNPA